MSVFNLVYFLLIGILQIIPQITISEGKPTMFLPLTIVVAVSMVKDFIEDWRRHKSDTKENNSQV
jgi:phospholipid-transporting ATPase